YTTSVTMKKGRPGIILTVLCEPAAVDSITQLIYRETTTIGVRYHAVSRLKLPRAQQSVSTKYGPVSMKRIEGPDGTRLAPEFDEAARIARERGIPLLEVMEE